MWIFPLILILSGPAESPDLALRLGRQCVAEISLSGRLEVSRADRLRQKIEECQLMWHILGAKVDYDHSRLYALIPRYNSLWKRRGTNRGWIFGLCPLTSEPEGWPDNVKWSVYAPIWKEVYAAAVAFVEAPSPHPCPQATQFGGRCDDDKHACDPPSQSWTRQLCNRPLTWWSQAYWSDRRVLPAKEAK